MSLRPGTTNGASAEKFFDSVSAQAERAYLASERYRYIVAEHDGALLGFNFNQ